MQLINVPAKLPLPFASSGAKNTIPTASQIGITPGAASLTDGFPPLTRTPIAAGGVPPSGLDMNGILFELSAIVRWANAGGGYPYDSSFASDSNVGGYPKGARVMRSDGLGYWLNTTDNNTTDPESAGAVAAGWVPDYTSGVSAITMTNANVTLTPLQYGKPIIVISGTLTANLNLIFPAIYSQWLIVNNTTGSFTITCKTASGTGVVLKGVAGIFCDGTNIKLSNSITPTLSGSRVITASETLTAADYGKVLFVNSATAITLTMPAVVNDQLIAIYNLGAGAILINGSTFFALEVVSGSSFSLYKGESIGLMANNGSAFTQVWGNRMPLGYDQTWQNVLSGKLVGTTYYNTTGRPIAVAIAGTGGGAGSYFTLTVNGVTVGYQQGDSTNGLCVSMMYAIVPVGGSYSVTGTRSLSGGTWAELR